jgi:hypothetical protein
MSDVEVTNELDADVMPGDTAVVVLLENDVEIIQTFQQGPPGPPGPAGPSSTVPGPVGPPGTSVLYGASNPNTSVGNNGDFYINTTTHFIYGPKANDVWPAGTSLIGPQGPVGPQGIQGPVGPQGPTGVAGIQGPQGVPGADGNTVLYGTTQPDASQGVDGNFYINTTTHFLFGPKAAGAWPAGTSLVGPQGQQGIQGPQGAASTVPGPQGPQGIPGASTVLISDTPPTGQPDSTFWWCSADGLLYVQFNDGNSTQWVIACPQPDPNTFLKKAGDTMTGPLVLPGNPTTAMQAAPKQYVDASHSPASRTRTVIPAGAGTYTTPVGCKAINVRMVGGGGGGGASASSGGGNGTNGGNSTFGPMLAGGGGQGQWGGTGTSSAASSGGDINLYGGFGTYGQGAGQGAIAGGSFGGFGGASFFGGGGAGAYPGGGGIAAQAPGSGGGGAGGGANTVGGSGGGAGGYCEKLFVNPAATYAYSVGAAGVAGAAGTGGLAGGNGCIGIIIIDEYY